MKWDGFMIRNKEKLSVDIRCFKAYGEVLDMGYKSGGIIYRAVKGCSLSDETAVTSDRVQSPGKFNWIGGTPDSLPFEDGRFDTAISFFSICLIDKKHERNKAIKEAARVIKEGGTFYIWDINIKNISLGFNETISVTIPGGETIDMKTAMPVLWGGYGLKHLLPVMEMYFDIKEAKDLERYFYVKAVKKKNNNRDDNI